MCCLSSLNLETYMEWHDHPTFVEDVMRFLDNVIQDFIERAGHNGPRPVFGDARTFRRAGRDGIPFVPQSRVPMGSVMAKVWNKRIFKQVKEQADAASVLLAEEQGPCPDAADYGIMERFSTNGDRADGVDLDHLWRFVPGDRTECGQPLQDPVGIVQRPQQVLESAVGGKGQRRRRYRSSITVNEIDSST